MQVEKAGVEIQTVNIGLNFKAKFDDIRATHNSPQRAYFSDQTSLSTVRSNGNTIQYIFIKPGNP